MDAQPAYGYSKSVERLYNVLFLFPSHKRIAAAITLFSMLWSLLLFLKGVDPSTSLLAGVSAALLTLLSDYASYAALRGEGKPFDFRRCSAVSLVVVVLWTFALAFAPLPSSAPELVVLCAAQAIFFRATIFGLLSRRSFFRVAVAALVQPALVCSAMAALLSAPKLVFPIAPMAALLLLPTASLAAMDYLGRKRLGISSLALFRAFMMDWMTGRGDELDEMFDRIGVGGRVQASLLVFRRKRDHVPKVAVLIPKFHMGPFRKLGSSLFPYVFSRKVLDKLGCPTVVFHGASDHTLDLASTSQCEKVAEAILESLPREFGSKASAARRALRSRVNACCQVLDGHALAAVTTSPTPCDDIPGQVNEVLLPLQKAAELVIDLVDAHNCAGVEEPPPADFGAIASAVEAALSEAARSVGNWLKVGFARVDPPLEFSKEVGPLGFSALAIETKKQLFLHLVIDGNNLIQGLRERMIEALVELGFSDAEVYTTDTHLMTAVFRSGKGYLLVGERTSHQKLIELAKEAASSALSNLEDCEVGASAVEVDAKLLGADALRSLVAIVKRCAAIFAVGVFLPLIAIPMIALAVSL